MPSVEGIAPRRATLQMLDAVLRSGQTLEAAGARVRGLSPTDFGLALAIAGETLRRIPDLDALIDSATRQRLPDDSKARMVLRIALVQKIALHTPEHALVSTALPLVDGGPRRLVHGVLGTLLRRGVPPLDAPHLPSTVEQRWTSAWGARVVEAARRQIASRPPLDLTFASDADARAYVAEHGGVSLAPKNDRLPSSAVTQLPGFETGGWWVQDLGASLPARLIPTEASNVLDLCAAPGGKTMQLAAAGHQVTAVDSSESRLGRLRENLERTKLEASLIAADAIQWEPNANFDSILLDAPCSATGTFRRHPEVLYRARDAIIGANSELQAKLLTRAAQWVKPGGTIVYSVCSLERQEGEEIIRDFIAGDPGFRVDPPRAGELSDFVPVSSEGWIRLLPGLLEDRGGLDGFFMARLVRTR